MTYNVKIIHVIFVNVYKCKIKQKFLYIYPGYIQISKIRLSKHSKTNGHIKKMYYFLQLRILFFND